MNRSSLIVSLVPRNVSVVSPTTLIGSFNVMFHAWFKKGYSSIPFAFFLKHPFLHFFLMKHADRWSVGRSVKHTFRYSNSVNAHESSNLKFPRFLLGRLFLLHVHLFQIQDLNADDPFSWIGFTQDDLSRTGHRVFKSRRDFDRPG